MNLLNHKAGQGLFAFVFYFAEGAPIGFIWWAMPTLLRKENIPLDKIGFFTASLTLPWVFKFLWAPLVDTLRSSRFGFTGWIASAQTMMCLTLLPLLFIPLESHFTLWWMLLLLHSLCAATQDVSIDALVINVASKKEHGVLNGYMQAGMLLGRSLFGGGALIMAAQFGTTLTIGLMIAAIFTTMTLLFFVKSPAIDPEKIPSFTFFRNNITQVFTRRLNWYVLAFALTSAAAFEAAGAFAGPFMTDHQFSSETIGFFFGVPVVAAMLIGGLIGGYLSDKLNRIRSIAIFLIGFVGVLLIISALGIFASGVVPLSWMVLYAIMYFFTGMFVAASYAMFMSVTNPDLGATQFSTLMAATNGCEAWAVWVAGLIAASYGYPYAFTVMCIVSLLSLIFLNHVGKAQNRSAIITHPDGNKS